MHLFKKDITTNFIFICLTFFIPLYSYSQDLTNIKDAKKLTVTGGISANSSTFASWGIEQERDPLFWMLNANINFNILGIIDIPFSANFTKANQTYNQPSFRQYGISPKYKSLTVHLATEVCLFHHTHFRA